MKKQAPLPIPATQQELAAYAGVSGTLMSMTYTRKHGNRNLNEAASAKMSNLLLTHLEAQRSGTLSPSLKKLQSHSAATMAATVKKMREDAGYADAHVTVLILQLTGMREKEQQDIQWLKTVDHALDKISKRKEPSKDRIWFEYQQQKVIKRLKKNGLAAQINLATKIEMEKAKALAYRNLLKQLLKK